MARTWEWAQRLALHRPAHLSWRPRGTVTGVSQTQRGHQRLQREQQLLHHHQRQQREQQLQLQMRCFQEQLQLLRQERQRQRLQQQEQLLTAQEQPQLHMKLKYNVAKWCLVVLWLLMCVVIFCHCSL
jgi:hypothetical protein